MEFQKVKVYVGIFGDYVAFHEIFFQVSYDLTNNIQLGDLSLEELENYSDDDNRGDLEIRTAILDKTDNTYYVKW